MILPIQISFHHMRRSATLEVKIRERAEKLSEFYQDITACRVSVEAFRRQHQGSCLYRVRVDITMPDDELVASRESDEHVSYKDVYVAVRDAFDSVQEGLKEYVKRRLEKVKSHATTTKARETPNDIESGDTVYSRQDEVPPIEWYETEDETAEHGARETYEEEPKKDVSM